MGNLSPHSVDTLYFVAATKQTVSSMWQEGVPFATQFKFKMHSSQLQAVLILQFLSDRQKQAMPIMAITKSSHFECYKM